MGGLQAAPALIAHDGSQEGVAIELTPLGSRALLGMPAGALWNTSLELEDVVGPGGVGAVGAASGRAEAWSDGSRRATTCSDALVRDDPLEPALRRSWQLLVASVGTVPVAELATTIGWTRQHFARRFAGEFGLSPKLAARVVRFERARRMLRRRRSCRSRRSPRAAATTTRRT